jgi:hypothetical protein
VRLGPAGAAACLVLLAGCRGTLSPLSNKLKIGEESYVVFVADGEEGRGDLFAAPPVSGTAFQVTFTRLDERVPALSPDGATVTFLRSREARDSTGVSLVFLNLINGAERRVAAPPGVEALRWSADGNTVLARSGNRFFRTAAPPQPLVIEPVPDAARPGADSLFRVLLGMPPLGEARPCSNGAGVCAWLASGDTLRLSVSGSAPVAWGNDSVGYFEDGALVVRPLAGGRTRAIRWSNSMGHPREPTWFPGTRVQRDSAMR